MTDSAPSRLEALAALAGVSPHWIDYRGVDRRVSADSLRAILTALEVRCDTEAAVAESLRRLEAEASAPRLPAMIVVRVGESIRTGLHGRLAYRIDHEQGTHESGLSGTDEHGVALLPAQQVAGYHRLEIDGRQAQLAVAPARCYGLDDALAASGRSPGARLWGLAAQLYSLRHSGDGGIGDFTALAQLADEAGRHGADALAVSPVHALFAADVERYSPYSPSSRLFLNALHVDPATVFGAARVQAAIARLGLGAELGALEARPLVAWPAAARARLLLLRTLYAELPQLDAATLEDFARFEREAGTALRDHACFEALQAHLLGGSTPCWHWRDWPAEYRDPHGPAVQAFAAARPDELRFHRCLQWLAERGLRAAQAAARAVGMAVGLIGDLAVGTDGGGSHAWSRQHDLLLGVGVGAPPDALNALGQGWGLTAFSPRALQAHGYAPFIELLRAQLRDVGGLRIDHVIGLGRLWLVPDGRHATEGAYLRYPLEDLLALIALESWRHRAVIIGEDMGTVPAAFRPRMDAAGILGMRVLWFERDWGLFVEPQRWPANVVALTTTHDLPTVAGWWSGRDIAWRTQLALYGEGQDEAGDLAARVEDRGRLWAAFEHAGVVSGAAPGPEAPVAVVDAALAFVAKTPSPLALIPAEDLLALDEQPNVPGTVDEHPNWRRRLPADVGTMLAEPRVAARLATLARERPRR